MHVILIAGVVFAAAAAGTGLIRRYALVRSVLDIPNERSSHQVPMPRGGGVAIVVAFVSGAVALWLFGDVDNRTALALTGSGLIVAMVGFLDDHRPVEARWRLVAHFAAAGWGLFWLGGVPPVAFTGAPVALGWVGAVAAAVAIVWLVNLYNFMDGIDGIAGVEAITVAAGAVLLSVLGGGGYGEWALLGVLAASVIGFLLWNFPPAKIFMGDAGSGFLGATFGLLTLHAGFVHAQWLWSWLILLGVFVVDATVTLLRRIARGENVSVAHRSHAFQHAAPRNEHHRAVTLGVAAINVVWLTPIALLVGSNRVSGIWGVALAYSPLVLLALRFDAGGPLRSRSRGT